MANCQKYNKATCGHMFKHYERAKVDGEYIKFHNQNINTSRSHLNYNLGPEREINQGEFIKQRCEEVYCLNRKDVNVLCSWVVTAPQNLPSKELKQFFKASYDFMANRYGQENVISSYVHMDEVTPHMHFAFVPVVYDKKKDRLKVSAKDVINRTELQVFHKELQSNIERILGHEVDILNEATRDGNKSIDELKRETAINQINKVQQECSSVIENATLELSDVIHEIKSQSLKAEIAREQIRAYEKIVEQTRDLLPEKKKKSFTGKVSLDYDEYSTIYELAKFAIFNETRDISLSAINHNISDTLNSLKKPSEIVLELQNDLNIIKKENEVLKQQNKVLNDKLNWIRNDFNELMTWINSDKAISEAYKESLTKKAVEELNMATAPSQKKSVERPILKKEKISIEDKLKQFHQMSQEEKQVEFIENEHKEKWSWNIKQTSSKNNHFER